MNALSLYKYDALFDYEHGFIKICFNNENNDTSSKTYKDITSNLLVDDILIKIFSLLSYKTLHIIRRVCRRWNNMILIASPQIIAK